MNDLFVKIDKQIIRQYKIKKLKINLKNVFNHKFFLIGGFIILTLVIISLFGNLIIKYDPLKMDLGNVFAPMSRDHFFGTDNIGRDIFSRVVIGARLSLTVGFISTFISTIIGTFFGLIAGYYGKAVDNVIMRFMDAIFSVPSLILAITFVSLMGPTIINIFLAISIIYIPVFARLVRSRVLEIKKEIYIEAEYAIGQSNMKIIFTHVLPNLGNVVIVQATAVFAEAIIVEAGLSFLGMGTPPPSPSWGSMLLEAKNYLIDYPLFAVFPGVAISIAVLGFNLLGDALRDILDPRLSR